MADGGILLSIDGSSCTTYMKEEVDRYRLVIGNKTCVLEKENNPGILRSPSAGKLLGYLVDDGAHVNRGQPYAEIEVMKMIVTLTATEMGKLTLTKGPGTVLDAGTVLATMELDDASLVTKTQIYRGGFDEFVMGTEGLPEKLNYVHNRCRAILENTLAGKSGFVFFAQTLYGSDMKNILFLTVSVTI